MCFLGDLGKIRCSVNENSILFAQNIILTHIKKKTNHKKLASKKKKKKRKVSIKLVRKQRITKAQLYFKDNGLLTS